MISAEQRPAVTLGSREGAERLGYRPWLTGNRRQNWLETLPTEDESALVRIYFLRCRRAIKIGYARDVEARVKSLQSGNPDPMILIGTVLAPAYFERMLHAEFGRDRLNGEWFKSSRKLLARISALVREGEWPNPARSGRVKLRKVKGLE
jgi:hypothetical protein